MLDQDVVREATRLTRAGQLVEATALLQRMLRGDRAPGPTSGSTARIALARLEPPTIDAKANVVEERESRRPAQATSTRGRKCSAPLGGMGEFSGLDLRGPIKRAPPSASDMVPEGTRFIEGTFSNAAGSRTYKLFIPSRYQGQPLPVVVMLHGWISRPAPGSWRTSRIASWSIPNSPRGPTKRGAGTGFARATSSGAGANPR